MKKLDKYILRNFFYTFVFIMLLITVVIVIVDLSENLDSFSKSNLGFKDIFFQYYVGFLPRILAMLIPLFVFITVILFTSRLSNRSEIIAVLSSGVSLKRFLLPYLLGSLFITLFVWYANQYLVPKANRIWSKWYATYDANPAADNLKEGIINSASLQNYYIKIDSNKFIGFKNYDTTSKYGDGFCLFTLSKNKIIEVKRAMRFKHDTATFWKIEDVTIRKINQQNEDVVRKESERLNLNLKSYELRKDEFIKDQLPLPILNDYIEGERKRKSNGLSLLLFEKHNRNAIPFSIIILTLMAAVIASQKIRGGSGMHIAVGIILSLIYVLLGRFANVFATKGNLNPILAAWIPNIIFTIVLFYLYKKRNQ